MTSSGHGSLFHASPRAIDRTLSDAAAMSPMDKPSGDGDAGQAQPPSRLARKLGTGDAVIVGLGSMIGAGVFSAVGPATRAAGNVVVVALLIAGALAYCNATSSAAL